MSVHVLNISLSQPDNSIGYIAHATNAAKTCLESSGVGTDEIDLLINVGNYRDNNMCEPSMAVLVQHELGINLNPLTMPVQAHTFSFDLINGTCGLLNAIQVANSILSTKHGKYALLVSGDAHPSGKKDAHFPYQHAGAAVLLERTESHGFKHFSFNTSSTFVGSSGYLDLHEHGLQSRTSIIVNESNDDTQANAMVQSLLMKFIKDHQVDTRDTILLPVNITPSSVEKLSKLVSLPSVETNVQRRVHTAELAFGLAEALHEHPSKDILCVVVGSGITVGCSLYQRAH